MTAPVTDSIPLTHEAIVDYDQNPMQLPVHHSTHIAITRGHKCAPRILAICCVCSAEFNLCDATGEDVDRLIAKAWRCEACCGL